MHTILIRSTLFLPYMSDSAPISGDMTNCSKENSDPRAPGWGGGIDSYCTYTREHITHAYTHMHGHTRARAWRCISVHCPQ